MHAVETAVRGTPTWVWVLLVYLLIRGAQAVRGGTTVFWRLAVVPAIFMAWGVAHLFQSTHTGAISAVAWIGSLFIGAVVGRMLFKSIPVQADRNQGLITLPGSWTPLILMMGIFTSKYWIGYKLAVTPVHGVDPSFVVLDASISGAITGIFFGRLYTYWRKYQAAPRRA